mgnify:CR=1 FL=1
MIDINKIAELSRPLLEAEVFSNKAFELLINSDISIPKDTSLQALVDSLKDQTKDIPQFFKPGEFADYNFTLFNSENFNIDLYIWTKKHTSIHNHHFTGAFKILLGSIYTEEFDFQCERHLNDFLDHGKLKLIKSQTASIGFTREIKMLDNFIHITRHLNNPTITICIRDKKTLAKPISGFFRNGLKINHRPKSTSDYRYFQDFYFQNDIDKLELSKRLSNDQSEIATLINEGFAAESKWEIKMMHLWGKLNE